MYRLQTLRTCNSKHRVAATHLLNNVVITSNASLLFQPLSVSSSSHGQMMSQVQFSPFSASACEMNKSQHEKLLSFSRCVQNPPKTLDRNDARRFFSTRIIIYEEKWGDGAGGERPPWQNHSNAQRIMRRWVKGDGRGLRGNEESEAHPYIHNTHAQVISFGYFFVLFYVG